MNTSNVRTLLDEIRHQRWQNTITVEHAKSQLENIDWATVANVKGLSVSCMQSMVNETLDAINAGIL